MDDVKSVLTMKETIQIVEKALTDHVKHKTQMLPRTYLFLDKYAGRVGFMPAYIEGVDACGLKIVSAYQGNLSKYGLPTVMATVILNDTTTGLPIAVMDGTHLTMMRTGAIGAIAAKYLSRIDSKVVGVIGAGVQGRGQLLGLSEVRKIKRVLVFDVEPHLRQRFSEEMSSLLDIEVTSVDTAAEAAGNVDILVTATPSPTPVLADDCVNPGLHITTIGVSTPGKQEIPTATFKRSKLVVDEIDQTSKIGGINLPFSQGILKKEDIYAEIGEIIVGMKPGRESDREVTVFVTSGLAIQDIATAKAVYEKARVQGIGQAIRFPF